MDSRHLVGVVQRDAGREPIDDLIDRRPGLAVIVQMLLSRVAVGRLGEGR